MTKSLPLTAVFFLLTSLCWISTDTLQTAHTHTHTLAHMYAVINVAQTTNACTHFLTYPTPCCENINFTKPQKAQSVQWTSSTDRDTNVLAMTDCLLFSSVTRQQFKQENIYTLQYIKFYIALLSRTETVQNYHPYAYMYIIHLNWQIAKTHPLVKKRKKKRR